MFSSHVEKHGYITKVNGGYNMKFCSNCGAQLEDSVKFCGGCGAAQDAAAPAQENFTYEQPAQASEPAQANNGFNDVIEKGKKLTGGKVWLIPVLAVGAVVVLVLVIFFFRSVLGTGAMTKKGAIKAYFKAETKRSAKAYINATMSPSMLKAYLTYSSPTSVRQIGLLERSNIGAPIFSSILLTDADNDGCETKSFSAAFVNPPSLKMVKTYSLFLNICHLITLK
jgi:hypothetical protein